MGHLRKVYSNRRPRGGTPGKRTTTAASETGKTPKDYGKVVRQLHGSKTDAVMEALAKQIAHRRKFG